MKKQDSLKIAIYSRKSKFTGKGESIENQIELCRQYISAHYGDTALKNITVYEDEGFSGGNTDRPQFQTMMKDARDKKLSAIVCYRLDRISRNISDFTGLIQEFEKLNISFISIREDFDTSSPMGRAMMYIASVFSQLERETIAERIRDNMHELAKTGRWLGGTTPTGYTSESVQNITVDGKTKKSCKLKLEEKEADLVKLIFNKFLETNSLTKVDTFLIQNHINTKNNIAFTRFAIKNILTNPVYMIADRDAYCYLNEKKAELFADIEDFDGEHGIIAYNRTIQKHGEAHKIREIQEWIVSVGKHTGIISGSDWIKVQSLLEQNRSKSFRKTRSNTALLSGILLCGKCGDYMRPKLTQRLNKNSELIYSYLCTTKERSHSQNCDIKSINGNRLDAMIIEEIKKLSEDSSEFIKSLEKYKKEFKISRSAYESSLEKLKNEQSETEKKLFGLVNALAGASGSTAADYIVKEIENLHTKNESLKNKLTEYETLTSEHVLADIEFDVLRDMLSSFKKTIDTMSVEEKRSAIKSCVKKIIWDGENIHLYLFGSDGDFSELPAPVTDTEPLCENRK